MGTPPELLDNFLHQSSTLTFDAGKLYKWLGGKWVHFPPLGLQVLLMEELHVQHHHIGG